MVEFDPTEIWEIDGKLGFRQEKHIFLAVHDIWEQGGREIVIMFWYILKIYLDIPRT